MGSFPGTNIVQRGVKYLDNRPAAFIRATMPYKVLDREVLITTEVYTLLYRGRLYAVQGAAPADRFAALAPSIRASIATFVIETW